MESKTPNKQSEEIERLSPDKLIRIFSSSPLILACVLSVIIHGLLTAATSWEYAWNRYVLKQSESSLEEQPGATNGTEAVATTNAPAAGQSNVVVVTAATNASGPVEDEETAMLKRHSNAPVVQAMMQVAGTNEIPKVADDIGLSIKETNPF